MCSIVKNDTSVGPVSNTEHDEGSGASGSEGTWSVDSLTQPDAIIACDPGIANIHISGLVTESEEVVHKHYKLDAGNGDTKLLTGVSDAVKDFIGEISDGMTCADKVLVVIENQFTKKMGTIMGAAFGSFAGSEVFEHLDVKLVAPIKVKKHFALKRARDELPDAGPSKKHRFNKEIALQYVNEKKLLGEKDVKDHNEADNILMIQYAIDNKL